MISDTVKSVIELQKNKSKRNELVKQKILSMINDKIVNYTKYNYTNCIFTIPNFIIGYLPYNIEDMSNYIIKSLKNNGLFVLKLNIENIYISWNINDLYSNQSVKSTVNKIKKNNNFLSFANKNKL